MENLLIPIKSLSDISQNYRQTPIGDLLEYHNLNKPFLKHDSAKLLVSMCMDNRKHLHIPDNFAYIIRSGGASLRYCEFKVSYAIAVGGVEHIALIGHTNCGMVDLFKRKDIFVQGLVDHAGWTEASAIQHFEDYSYQYEIGNEIGFILREVKRLRLIYPKLVVAPLLYRVEDNLLYMIQE